jgi:hypothetical protein
MRAFLTAGSACVLIALAPGLAVAMPPAAKQYLPVVPTANGPKVQGATPTARPAQLTPAARQALRGPSGAELRRVATATALGAPARSGHGGAAAVAGDRPSFVSATFDALAQGAVLALLAGFAVITALLVYLSRSGRGAKRGSPVS